MDTSEQSASRTTNWRRAATRAGKRALTVYVDEELLTELKVISLRRKLTLQEMAETALEEYFERAADEKSNIPAGMRKGKAA